MIGIYKIISPTNKTYIGQSVDIDSRKRVYQYFNSYKNSIGPKLYNSLNKYGFDKHKFEIIEECTLKQLNKKETLFKQIELDKVDGDWSKVLFCELHDRGGGPRSKVTKQKIRKNTLGTKGYPKGIKRPKSFGLLIKNHKTRGSKISKTLKENTKRGEKISNSTLGIKKSKKHSLNISKGNKGISRNKKPIIQYSLKMKKIKEWPSISEATKKTKITSIGDCVRNRQKRAGQFIWKYK